jgi:hypothetical protein
MDCPLSTLYSLSSAALYSLHVVSALCIALSLVLAVLCSLLSALRSLLSVPLYPLSSLISALCSALAALMATTDFGTSIAVSVVVKFTAEHRTWKGGTEKKYKMI